MTSYITVMTVTLPSDLIVPKSLLESHSIECSTKDELTIQVDNFLSNAMGGVKLQVRKEDFEKAKEILLDANFVLDLGAEPSWLNRKLAEPKFYKRFRLTMYTLLSIILIWIVFVGVVFYLNRPGTTEFLINKDWCLVQIDYGKDSFEPYTLRPGRIKSEIRFVDICDEFIVFGEYGSLTIPGFNSRQINGKWSLEGDKIRIYQIDTLEQVFEGLYDLEIDEQLFIMESEYTRFYGDGSRLWLNR